MSLVSSIKMNSYTEWAHCSILRNEMNITLTTSGLMMYLFVSLEEHVKINGKKIAVKFIHEA